MCGGMLMCPGIGCNIGACGWLGIIGGGFFDIGDGWLGGVGGDGSAFCGEYPPYCGAGWLP